MPSTPDHCDANPDANRGDPTIQIVEDEVLLRLAVADFLQDSGFKVLQADTGDAALEIFRQRVLGVDLVFTDVRMPGQTDGFALAKWIRENRPGTPVIVASGETGRVNVQAELTGGEPFLPKPYDFNLLVLRIQDILGKRNSAAGA